MKTTHWGEWIKARSRAIGFRSDASFAASVGVTRQRIAKWYAMQAPPASMRRVSERGLARALRISPRTLFVDYAATEPTTPPELPQASDDLRCEVLRCEVKTAADLLSGDALRVLAAAAHALTHLEPEPLVA